MSEETPRLTRRQMREQGLLSAPADGPSVLDTTELRLRRPSRKELRELAEHETAQGRSVRDGGDYVGEPTQAMKAVPRAGVSRSGADPEPVQHERNPFLTALRTRPLLGGGVQAVNQGKIRSSPL